VPLLHRVGWIHGDLLAYFETLEDFQLNPVIAARLYLLKVDTPDASKYRRINSLRSGLLFLVRRQRLEQGQ
jgi:hypothetical protein